jgi:hypothetical protein
MADPAGGYCTVWAGRSPEHPPYKLLAEILRDTPKLDGALCARFPGLHDGEDHDKNRIAIAICQSCPVQAQCAAWLAGMTRHQRRHIHGVWAGTVVNQPRKDNNMVPQRNIIDKLVPGPVDMAQVGGWLEAQVATDLATLTDYYNHWLELEDDKDEQHKLFRILIGLSDLVIKAYDLRNRPENMQKLRADAADYLVCSTIDGMAYDIWAVLTPAAKAALIEVVNNRKDNEK